MTQQDHITALDLTGMSQTRLNDLYRRVGEPGSVPTGDTQGTALLLPGFALGTILQRLAFLLFWQGKVFDSPYDDLRNKIGPTGFQTIRAEVYRGKSWMDLGEATILDYSRSSMVARWIRDEIREVSPGVWLGKVFIKRWHVLDFTLTA